MAGLESAGVTLTYGLWDPNVNSLRSGSSGPRTLGLASGREQPEKQRPVWLVNRQNGMLIKIKPDSATDHAEFVLLSSYPCQHGLGNPLDSSGSSGP
jgi:hypothetical protein